MMTTAVVVPWHNEQQRDAFLHAWRLRAPGEKDSVGRPIPDWLVLQHDATQAGCARTKNAGIRAALQSSRVDTVVILDDDCYPDISATGTPPDLEALVEMHRRALAPQQVVMFACVTDPPSRGTPYFERTMTMSVAASMGFWSEIGDYCAVRQLAHAQAPMTWRRVPLWGPYFPLCGMNLAFRPRDWWPWCQFIDVARFDDIWMGWLWQYRAYAEKYCFNLAGPTVRHARQSNVWKNLEQETRYLRENETLWRSIALMPSGLDYATVAGLLPVPVALPEDL